jgi:hypothetical protein
VFLKSLPTTASGKIDRNKLPPPTYATLLADDVLVTESFSPLQTKIAQTMSDSLQLPLNSLGLDVSFFADLGISSLDVARLVRLFIFTTANLSWNYFSFIFMFCR